MQNNLDRQNSMIDSFRKVCFNKISNLKKNNISTTYITTLKKRYRTLRLVENILSSPPAIHLSVLEPVVFI